MVFSLQKDVDKVSSFQLCDDFLTFISRAKNKKNKKRKENPFSYRKEKENKFKFKY